MELDQNERTALLTYLNEQGFRTNQTDWLCRIEQVFWLYNEPLRSQKLQEIEQKYAGKQ